MRGTNRSWGGGRPSSWFPDFWLRWTLSLDNHRISWQSTEFLISACFSRHKSRPTTTHVLPPRSINPDSTKIISEPPTPSPSSPGSPHLHRSSPLGPRLHQPPPQGAHPCSPFLFSEPLTHYLPPGGTLLNPSSPQHADLVLRVYLRRRNVASEFSRTGLKLLLYHFLPLRVSLCCVHLHRESDHTCLGGFLIKEGLWSDELHEEVQTAPLSSSSSYISECDDSGSWMSNASHGRRDGALRQLSYHLSVFWSSFQILKAMLE